MFYRSLVKNFKLNHRLYSNLYKSKNVTSIIIKKQSGPCSSVSVSVCPIIFYSNTTINKVNFGDFDKFRCQNIVNYSTNNDGTSSVTAETVAPPVPVVEYNEIKDLPNHPEKLLIDVREPNELKETGQIPTSINIPLGDVQAALSDATSDESFKSRYGHSKPNENDQVIFSCRSGVRAEKAANIAIKLGYSNVKNYKGSWLDWAEHEGLPTST